VPRLSGIAYRLYDLAVLCALSVGDAVLHPM